MPKILTLDIETRPSLAYVWGLFRQNISLPQLQETAEVICFAAKWYGEDEVIYSSTYHDGKKAMVSKAFNLLSEADAVIHYNGNNFDIPHLNREFLLEFGTAPAPFTNIDLLRTVRKNFRFTSNKLDHIVQQLGLGAKTSHTGFQLWVDCLNNDADAWELMKEYNMQDVVITEKLYDKLLPWLSGHPHIGLYDNKDEDRCPNCGSEDLRPQGKAYTSVSVFQRYRCGACGKWSRGNRRLTGSGITSVKQ